MFNNKIKDGLKKAFSKIKEEMDDFREAINQNTNEIHITQDSISLLENKLDKLEEQLENLSMEVKRLHGLEEKSYTITTLTPREKEVFVLLYEANEWLSYSEIARRLGFTIELVTSYVTNLLIKGVPVLKTHKDDDILAMLDSEFKSLQAKKNIVGLV